MEPKAGSEDKPGSTERVDQLTDHLTQILSVLLDFESPWVWARQIVEDAVKRYVVDVATLWRVDGDLLELVGGVVMGNTLRPLLAKRHYKLDWEQRLDQPQGITAAVAVLNKATLINSQEELRDRGDRLGHLDDYLYPGIPDGPFNKENGFGCLFAVPLTLDDPGRDKKESAKERPRSNKDRVAGVFKIERRRKQSRVEPFDDIALANFELVADTLEHLLRRSYHRQKRAKEHVRDVLMSVRPEDLKEHHEERLRAYSDAFQSIAKIDVDLEASKSVLRNLERDLPEAVRWIHAAKQSILDALRPQPVDTRASSSRLAVLNFQRPELESTDRTIKNAETVRDQVQALVESAGAQPLNAESTDEEGRRVLVDDLIRRAQAGFAQRPGVSQESKDTALNNLRHWLLGPEFEEYRPQLEWLIKKESWDLLLDSFHRILPFGTGGRRGPVGIGPNRFNSVTLKSSVQGHAKYLLARYPGQELSVVIAYDVRKFSDLRGLYNPELNSLLGMTSRDFAVLAAEEYTANLVRVFLPESDEYLTTPELSFTIRRLGAHGGLNISASHNHPDDNGGKFFGSHGGQEVPPYDGYMAKEVAKALAPLADGPRLLPKLKTMPLDEARLRGLLMKIPADLHQAYLDVNIAEWKRVADGQIAAPDQRALIVFTPLHGTGTTSALEVLRGAGFRVETVRRQMDFDGSFPTVPFRAPNPEVPESMHAAVAKAIEVNADLVLACDPDADRIGVCARRRAGGYRFLTGNEIAVVATKFKLESLQRQHLLPKTPLVIKTEVTTELLRTVTEAAGGTIIGDLLVGFKYHVDVLNQLESTGHYKTLEASLQDFVIAVEESHGVLVIPECRDKDAAGAALLLAQLAEVQRSKGLTVVDYLDRIYLEYGYHSNIVSSMVMSGAQGLSQIQRVQEGLRARARDDQRGPWLIAGLKVMFPVVDHLDPDDAVFGPLPDSDSAREARNVLVFNLEGGARVIIRPSGTEPKNKAYIEVSSSPLGLDAGTDSLERAKTRVDELARAIADDFTRQMLAIIGIHLADYALRISGLVPLDKRIAFADEFMPALQSRVEASIANHEGTDDVSPWIDQQLKSYGEDARGLVAEAVEVYVANQRRELAVLPDDRRGAGEQVLDVIAGFFQTKRD